MFQDPLDALAATLEFQLALETPDASDGLQLRVRCGVHAGVIERRDGDYFGGVVNRAARIMNAAHGGQVLTSQAIAELVQGRLADGMSLRDLGALRLRDLAGAERVFQLQHAGLRPSFPALRSLEAVPNNLPQQVTTFIGREREQVQINAALKTSRLLTLTGIGGIGKTRLSLQVAADVAHDYADGVWFVELAPITDGDLVPQAVAAILGVKEEAGRALTDALVACARERQLLLVLDNCEHLVSACAELARQLLQAGPRFSILATSREPLNIPEKRSTVPPLSVPSPTEAWPRTPSCGSRPCISSSIAPRRCRLHSGIAIKDMPRLSGSAGVSTAFRSRLSWRRRACALSVEEMRARQRPLPAADGLVTALRSRDDKRCGR